MIILKSARTVCDIKYHIDSNKYAQFPSKFLICENGTRDVDAMGRKELNIMGKLSSHAEDGSRPVVF